MFHFAWADQREKQRYKSDVSLKRGIQISRTLGKKFDPNLQVMPLFNRHNKTTIDCGFEFGNNIESINLNLVTKCFLARPKFLNHEGLGAWFLTHLTNDTVVQLSQTAKPKYYIYSVACEVWYALALRRAALMLRAYISGKFPVPMLQLLYVDNTHTYKR